MIILVTTERNGNGNYFKTALERPSRVCSRLFLRYRGAHLDEGGLKGEFLKERGIYYYRSFKNYIIIKLN